ncbi:hypothetical protein EON67_11105 [archaeon]|nr:MAG: hypothetical protein EON67_11105 [archaeon]
MSSADLCVEGASPFQAGQDALWLAASAGMALTTLPNAVHPLTDAAGTVSDDAFAKAMLGMLAYPMSTQPLEEDALTQQIWMPAHILPDAAGPYALRSVCCQFVSPHCSAPVGFK